MSETEVKTMLAQPLEECIQDGCATGWEYTLTADARFPIQPELAAQIGAVVHEWFTIEKHADGWAVLTIRRPYSTDGATLVPDFSHGATLSRCQHTLAQDGPDAALALCGPFVAHWPHDLCYQFAVDLAAAWDCSVWAVIRWANRYFNWLMLECGTPAGQRKLYYAGVCLMGHQFAWIGRQARAVRGWFDR